MTARLALIDPHRAAFRQVSVFAVIGGVSTVAYVALYAVLRSFTPAAAANGAALLVTAVGNTEANRRLTFEIRDRDGLARDHAAGLLAFAIALAITTGALAALTAYAPHHSRTLEVAVLVSANVAATLIRFILLRVALGRTRLPGLTAETSATRIAR